MPYFSLIVARLPNGGIGYRNKLPWHYQADLQHFKNVTTEDVDGHPNNVIMGRNTWMSLSKILPGRKNVVISSRSREELEIISREVEVYSSLSLALENCQKGKTFVIGGKMLYEEAVNSPYLESIYETVIYIMGDYPCDVFFIQQFGQQSSKSSKSLKSVLVKESNFEIKDAVRSVLKFSEYHVVRESGEQQYLELLSEVTRRSVRQNRTSVLTHSVFGRLLRFDLSKGFPLFTTKQIFLRGIFEELMWIIRGQTDSRILSARRVHIWDGNTTREFLDNRGLQHLPVGDIGPGYGHTWRRYGAGYDTCENILPGGIDQLKYVLNLLKNDPYDRRMVVSAWNPCDLDKIALPQCHILFQFYLDDEDITNKKLCCKFDMRSCDLFHGFPFNIASYSLLTHMFAKLLGYGVGEVIATLGDAHIYDSHMTEVMQQLFRPVRDFPQLEITKALFTLEDIEQLEFTDITVTNYHPHKKLSAPMVV
jgi:dihydrofolate reductase / thymidylate synthase